MKSAGSGPSDSPLCKVFTNLYIAILYMSSVTVSLHELHATELSAEGYSSDSSLPLRNIGT